MWIGICEDETKYRDYLERSVRSVAQPYDRVTAYANGSDLLDAIYSSSCHMDMLFLDMEMPGLSGIEAGIDLLRVSAGTQIVIITRHVGYALKSFAIRPTNYLIKPVSVLALKAEIDRARLIAGDNIDDKLRIDTKNTVTFVALKDIVYIECMNHTLYVHTTSSTYAYKGKISAVSNELVNKGFGMIHKSFLVNWRYVKSFDKSARSVILISGGTLPVSELRIKFVLKAYTKFWQRILPKNTAPVFTGADCGDQSDSRSFAGTLG